MIEKLQKNQIKQIARLHRNELSGFLPELGEEFLELFYLSSLNLPELFTFIDVEKGKIQGFVTSISNANGLYKKIVLTYPLRFGSIFLRYIITHIWKTGKIIQILAYPGFSEGGAELLSIAVSGDCRLRGIGKKLLAATAKEFKRRGIKKFKISVYDRLPANGFYKKIGCRKISSFDFLGEKMNYYEYKIDK